jgi:hypothetical protein
MEYLKRLPPTIPADRVLVHNRERPTGQLGSGDFRAWLQPANSAVEVCDCSFAPKFAEHYRLRRNKAEAEP